MGVWKFFLGGGGGGGVRRKFDFDENFFRRIKYARLGVEMKFSFEFLHRLIFVTGRGKIWEIQPYFLRTSSKFILSVLEMSSKFFYTHVFKFSMEFLQILFNAS